MEYDQQTEVDPTTVTGFSFVSIYADDFPKAFKFYTEVLGFQKEYDMGEDACFLKVGEEDGLYLEGGHRVKRDDPLTTRATFTLSVPSAFSFFAKLKEYNVEFIDEAPRKVGEGHYWFQFLDPAGNILEALGGE